MGTSTDHAGGAGGNWTSAKRSSTSFSKYGGRDRAECALARLIAALGGAYPVSARSTTASAAAVGLGRLFAISAEAGLDVALGEFGLEELVDRPTVEVVAAIVDVLAGAGEDLEGQAARSALCDVFESLAGGAESYDDFVDSLPGAASIAAILCGFVVGYLYLLFLPVVDERIERLDDEELRVRRERELRDAIEAAVESIFSCTDGDPSVWVEAQIEEIQRLLRETLAYLEGQCT